MEILIEYRRRFHLRIVPQQLVRRLFNELKRYFLNTFITQQNGANTLYNNFCRRRNV